MANAKIKGKAKPAAKTTRAKPGANPAKPAAKTARAKPVATSAKTKPAAKAKPVAKTASTPGSHDDALRTIGAGDWNGGLAALAALWATVRCADLAAEIERLSAHALANSPVLTGEGAAFHKAWEKWCAKGEMVGLERLLAPIRSGTAVELRARFDRLRERAPDPRMTMLVPLFANELHLRSDQTRAVWTAFWKLCTHTGDPRATKGLTRLAGLAQKVLDTSKSPRFEYFEQYMVEQIPTTIAKLPAAGSYGGVAALRKAVDALVKKPVVQAARKVTDVDSLYAHVLDDPHDLGARQVWADALMEAGDDRGTFVMLQLQAESRPLTPAEDKQMAQLLAANRLRWLGDAGATIEAKTATFRRGVLDSAELSRKASASDLDARELRTVAQLYARTPALLRHANLVSLSRIGRGLVPNPQSTTGPVGFDYFGPGGDFDFDDVTEIGGFGRTGITHLEMGLPEDCAIDPVKHAFPTLDTVSVGYSWSVNGLGVFEPLMPWLAGKREVIFRDIMDSREADDGWFVERLPTSNVHFVYGGGELYRSYVRTDGKLHAVFTDTSTKGGFSDEHRRKDAAGLANWIGWGTKFFKKMPAVDSLVFRQRSTWHPVDVDAVAASTKHLSNVTLPKAKKI